MNFVLIQNVLNVERDLVVAKPLVELNSSSWTDTVTVWYTLTTKHTQYIFINV